MKKKSSYWFFTATVFAGLLLPFLVQDGMFLDGVTYSTLAKNMANGYGSFCDPHYTQTFGEHFQGHPPFSFIVESVFFKVLGNSIYTERFYCLFAALITAWGIALFWKLLNKNTEAAGYAWLPVLLWITMPLNFWAYRSNLIEITLGMFTLFAAYFITRALLENKIIYLPLAALLILCAFLSKGPVGLFPLAVPGIFALTNKPFRFIRPVAYIILLAGFAGALFYAALVIFPGLESNLNAYLELQLRPALNGTGQLTTGNRFYILGSLAVDLLFCVLVLLIVGIKKLVTTKTLKFENGRVALFFLLVALSASLPLMVSLKQRGFYALPAVPFYVLGIGVLVFPDLKTLLEKCPPAFYLWLRRCSFAALAVVLVVCFVRAGKPLRDKEKLEDAYALTRLLQPGTILGCTQPFIFDDWQFLGYLGRLGYISLDCHNEHEYFITTKDNASDARLLENYTNTGWVFNNHSVFRKKAATE